MKKGKNKMKGFMCQTTAVNAMCMSADPRSVVMPRKFDRIRSDDTRLLNHSSYSRKTQDQEQKPMSLPKPLQLASSDHVFQVVVMRVALHCQGCAGKVKKHLSRMEGVTSFSIELESKKVTVMGHISPVGVLESISKVKRAEFWPC